MPTYAKWRLVNGEWKVVAYVGTDKIACCATYERVLKIGQKPWKYK